MSLVDHRYRHTLAVSLFVVATVWLVYSDGVSQVLILDSFNTVSSITTSSSYQLHRLWQDALSEQSGILGRPLAVVSFGFQKLIGFGRVEDFKLVNVATHLFVFYLIFRLISSIVMTSDASQNPSLYLIILLSCGIWSVAPLHVSTVLYTVQRMTILSSLFSLLCLMSWRRYALELSTSMEHKSLSPLIVGTLCFCLAIFSKENAAALPAILAILLLYDSRNVTMGREKLVSIGVGLLLVSAVFALAGCYFLWPSFASAYETREFDVVSRLWYQMFAVTHYIKQFLLPDVSIMGVIQDDFKARVDALSILARISVVSLFSTLVAVSLFLWRLETLRLSALGLSFMWLALIMESSVIPLELYFEHRFYFPSIGLILVFVNVYILLVEKLPSWLRTRAPLVLLVLFFANAFNTVRAVSPWAHPDLLAISAYRGHPESLRANAMMVDLHTRHNNYAEALQFSEAMSRLTPQETVFEKHLRDVSLICRAQMGGYELAGVHGPVTIRPDLFRSNKLAGLSAQYVRNNAPLLACNDFRDLLLSVMDYEFSCGSEVLFKKGVYMVLQEFMTQEAKRQVAQKIARC